MATPTRPCPYCGAAVLSNAPACGTCGRPMPPMAGGAPGPAPAKTMFGYAAPQIPGRPAAPAPQPPQPARPAAGQPGYPPQQQGFQPPQQQGFQQPQAPQAPNPYGQPPQAANPYGQPQQPQGFGQPPQAANPYGQPQQPQGFGQPPQAANPYGQPQQPQGFGQPPQAANPYGQPQQPQGFGQPPQAANPYGQPQQPQGFGQPQPNPYGQPQQPQGFGQAQPNPYGQPQQPGFGAQPGYPQAPNPYAQQQPDMGMQHNPLGNLANRLPQSAPGTLFGFPISTLRDAAVQRKILFLAGVALVASIVVPISLHPTVFPFSSHVPKWDFLLWPLISGAAYLLVAAAPPDLRQKFPPVVLQWLPFAVAFIGLFQAGHSGMISGADTLYVLGYAVLVFGLLARIAQPQDQIARVVIAVGGGMMLPGTLDAFHLLHFSGVGFIFVIAFLLNAIISVLGVACILFVVPPQKLPPALQSVDAFGPIICAVLIVWLPAFILLMGLGDMVHSHGGVEAIIDMARALLYILAYFGVLMMSSPAAYEEAKAMFVKAGGGGGGGGGYPPAGGGYPPQGGGYPPQGGGYPPQGGGYPPQGGGGWQ